MAKLSAVGFSIGIVIAISTFFIFAICGILYFYWGNSTVVNDSLSTAASFFGGFATLGAAIVAAYLYTDWKEPHNSNIEAQHKKEILGVLRNFEQIEEKYNRLVNDYIKGELPTIGSLSFYFEKVELDLFYSNANNLLSLLDELFYMTHDNNIRNMKKHFFEYAQYYSPVLFGLQNFPQTNNEAEFREFLGKNRKFNYLDDNGKEWTDCFFYRNVFQGTKKVGIKKYISENMKK